MIALEHARLLRRQAELLTAPVQSDDAAEHVLVHENAVPVPGLAWRQVALDLQNGIVAMGAGEEMEDAGHARERLPAPFERVDGIGEGRLRRIGSDGGHLDFVRGKRPVEGRHELLRLDAAEWRYPETAGPFLQQRIIAAASKTEAVRWFMLTIWD